MREIEMTAKTVEEAVEAACRELGVDRDDLGVSYEVLEFPTRDVYKRQVLILMSSILNLRS